MSGCLSQTSWGSHWATEVTTALWETPSDARASWWTSSTQVHATLWPVPAFPPSCFDLPITAVEKIWEDWKESWQQLKTSMWLLSSSWERPGLFYRSQQAGDRKGVRKNCKYAWLYRDGASHLGKCWSYMQNMTNDKQPVSEKLPGLASDQQEKSECQLQKQVFFVLPPPFGQGDIGICPWLWWQIQLAVAAARRLWQGEQQAAIDTAVQNALRLEYEKTRKKLEKEKSSWNKERECLCSQVELLKAQQRTGVFCELASCPKWKCNVACCQQYRRLTGDNACNYRLSSRHPFNYLATTSSNW